MILSKMRTGVFSGLFLGVLVLGGVGLVLSDGAGTFRDGVGSTDVAKIDGRPIKSVEFDRLVRTQLQAQNIPATEAYRMGLVDRILQNEIMSRLLRKAAFDYGIIASDKTVANELHKALLPLAGPKGDVKQALAGLLQSQGMSEKMLVESVRNDISTGLLRQTIGGGVYVPQAMAEAFYQWNLEERDIEYVSLPATSVKLDKPTEEQLAKFYDTIKSEYAIPETRNVTIGVLDTARLSTKQEVTDAQVKEFYDSHQDDFKTEATRTIEQAVLRTEKEANDVLKEAQGSKDLKGAVKKVTGKDTAYNKPSKFEEKALPSQLAGPAFTAPVKSFAGPVETPLGFHVAYIQSEQEAAVKPLDDVKTQIKKELSDTASSDAAFEVTNKIEDRLAEGESPDSLKDEFKLNIIKLENLSATDVKIAALKSYSADEGKIIQAAFTTNAGESSPLSEISGGKMITVHVNGVKEARAKNLADVKDEVIAKWSALEKRRKLLVRSLEVTTDIDSGKTTLEKIAAENKTPVKKAKVVRGSKAPAGLNSQGVAQIMATDTTKAVAIPDIESIQIVTIKKVSLPKKSPSKTELNDIEKNLSLDLQEERFVSFINHIERSNKVEINKALLDQMYGQEPAE
ncbi:MAG: hypothetical protein DI586_07855 [Micavibrio aeruginosavorus]|uniref:Periplasmic chaperone PpiD n=1 Tax=Micavibrio aeruginosavorus TaxID=349221 RepID=A0A2W5FGI5_9BACT|nr:MAG: hypothetical protein DI586_07855 [Micavibrio aeruginosavorus]